MRPSNKSRSRNKPGNNGQGNSGGGNANNNPRRGMGNIINRVFESAGPDGKVRGTPQQIIDKYQALARDAQVSGDRVAAENYLQHSEHYSRLLVEAQREQGEQQRFNQSRDDTPRGDDAPEMPRQHQPAQAPIPLSAPQPAVGFGLTTIDPEDSDYFGGPIETPEGGRRRVEERPAPPQPRFTQGATLADPVARIVEAAPEAAPSPAEPEAAPTKRPRTRRKAKAEPGIGEQAEQA